ncbi:unnamed protein product [Lactuca saligna]|uniref:Uncharacterized protein n=1 Tax=Lactuca saligna TaxID=75948 RepID=A0AA35VF85_LACSI|nr:unnamed protein product [Lactuca saligna]
MQYSVRVTPEKEKMDSVKATPEKKKARESTWSGTNQINVVKKLVIVNEFSTIDFCKYIFDSLVSRKEMWKRDDKTCYYTGTILLLTLVHVYNMKFSNPKLVKKLPFI